MGTWVSFPGSKATGARSWPLTSYCRGQECVALYLHPQYVSMAWCLLKHRDLRSGINLATIILYAINEHKGQWSMENRKGSTICHSCLASVQVIGLWGRLAVQTYGAVSLSPQSLWRYCRHNFMKLLYIPAVSWISTRTSVIKQTQG